MIKLLRKTLSSHKDFFIFSVVGVINNLFGYSIFSLLIFLKTHYILAAFFSNIITIIFSFNTFGRIVFKGSKRSLLKFIALYGFIYLLNISIIATLLPVIKNIYIDGGISIIICAIISFFINKFYVFK